MLKDVVPFSPRQLCGWAPFLSATAACKRRCRWCSVTPVTNGTTSSALAFVPTMFEAMLPFGHCLGDLDEIWSGDVFAVGRRSEERS